MPRSSDNSVKTAIIAAIIGGICTIVAALVSLASPLIERALDRRGLPTAVADNISIQNGQNEIQSVATEDLVSFNKPSLISAIRLLGDVSAQAQATLDESILSTVFSGEALKYYQTDLENLRKNQLYAISIRHDLEFESFKLNSDGSRAEVHATPIWETIIHALATRQCVAYRPPTKVPQTLYLEKRENGWITYAIVFDIQNPDLQPCP